MTDRGFDKQNEIINHVSQVCFVKVQQSEKWPIFNSNIFLLYHKTPPIVYTLGQVR